MSDTREWKWFGGAGHFIGGTECRFHLCTLIGEYIVSTVGDYRPRGEQSEKPTPIGYQRTYETMAFRLDKFCDAPGCLCGMPLHDGRELDFAGYHCASDATAGHMEMCRRYAEVTP